MYILFDLCNSSSGLTVILIVKTFFKLACLLAPFLITVVSMIGIFKIISSGKDDDLKDYLKLSIKRIIAGFVIFFIPTIINYVYSGLLGDKNVDFLVCFETASKEKVASLKAKEEAEAEKEKKTQEKEDEQLLKEAYEAEQKQKGAKKQSFAEWKEKKEEEERKQQEQQQYTGGEGSNLTGNAWVQNLLSGAKEVTDYIREHNFTYGYATKNPALDQSEGIVACDNCVGWFLYKAGYIEGQPSFYGLDLASSQTFMQERGFTKITDKSKLQPGDIIYVNPDSSGFPGHVFLLGNYIGDGAWERYDCGSINRIRLTEQYSSYTSQPFHEQINNFIFAYRSPKAS